jgi:hypothetical protein
MTAPDGRDGASRTRELLRRHEVLASGILCGVAGGVLMVATASVQATREGLAAAYPLQVIGESFVGPEALGGAAKIAFGALVHLATSAALGVLVAAVVPRDFPSACAMGVGVGLALFALMFMMSLVVPWANPGFRGAMQDIGGAWVVGHAVLGLALGASPALRRRLWSEARAPAGHAPARARTVSAP